MKLRIILLVCFLCRLCSAQYVGIKPVLGEQIDSSHSLSQGLVGFWLMNEGGGSKVFDLSGNGNTGTFYGDTKWVPGKFGSCLSFDGNGDYVTGTTLTQITSPPYTFCAWFNTKSVAPSSAQVIFTLQNTASYWADLAIYDDDIRLGIRAGGDAIFATVINVLSTNQWYFVCGVFAADNDRILYLDGINVTNSSVDVDYNPTGTYKIGIIDTTAYPFNGTIDDVMIFNRALTAQEIQQLYREPFGMFRPSFDLKMYWGIPVIGGAPPQIF